MSDSYYIGIISLNFLTTEFRRYQTWFYAINMKLNISFKSILFYRYWWADGWGQYPLEEVSGRRNFSAYYEVMQLLSSDKLDSRFKYFRKQMFGTRKNFRKVSLYFHTTALLLLCILFQFFFSFIWLVLSAIPVFSISSSYWALICLASSTCIVFLSFAVYFYAAGVIQREAISGRNLMNWFICLLIISLIPSIY